MHSHSQGILIHSEYYIEVVLIKWKQLAILIVTLELLLSVVELADTCLKNQTFEHPTTSNNIYFSFVFIEGIFTSFELVEHSVQDPGCYQTVHLDCGCYSFLVKSEI